MIKPIPNPSDMVHGITGAMGALTLHPKPGATPAVLAPTTPPPLAAAALPKEHFSLRFLKVVTGVHQDDIHCLTRLKDDTFITGSKDGCLKKWTMDGSLVKVISAPDNIDYRKWITALATFDDKSWICGTREGEADLWNNEGTKVVNLCSKEVHAPFPNGEALCKQRNVDRISCITSFASCTGKPFFLAGWATQFTLHDAQTRKRLRYTYTSNNDWVYVIQPLAHNSLLVVTGCRLDLYELKTRSYDWELKRKLIVEEPPKGKHRRFISAVTPLLNNEGKYGAAVFDGSVRVYDLKANNTIFRAEEHSNRVWAIENIAQHCFASCGDEGLVKLWDIRTGPRSVAKAIGNNREESRVSVLMLVNPNQLMGGSCPNDPQRSETKAQFTYWDIRRLAS